MMDALKKYCAGQTLKFRASASNTGAPMFFLNGYAIWTWDADRERWVGKKYGPPKRKKRRK